METLHHTGSGQALYTAERHPAQCMRGRHTQDGYRAPVTSERPLEGSGSSAGLGLGPRYLAISDVDRQVNIPKGARADFPNQLVFSSDNKLCFGAAAARHDPGRKSADNSNEKTPVCTGMT